MNKKFEFLFHQISIDIIFRKFKTKMNETIMEIIKRSIRWFSQSYDFRENRFVIIPIKGAVNLLDKMFEGVNGSDRKFVTPFLYVHFECEDKQPAHNILTLNIMFCAKFKKTSGVLENGCSTLNIKFQILQFIDYLHGQFQICNSRKTCRG